MGYFTEVTPDGNSARRQVLRGVLFGFLAFIAFLAAYLSWRSLFQLDPVTTVIWAVAGMAGLWGLWRIVISERAREHGETDDGFGVYSGKGNHRKNDG